MQIQNFPGGATTRETLLTQARQVAEQPHPYKSSIEGANENFLSAVESYEGSTLGEIKQNVDAKAAEAMAGYKKARKIDLGVRIGGVAAAAAGYFAPIPGPLKTVLLAGGAVAMLASMFTMQNQNNAAHEYNQTIALSSQLDGWGTYFAAQQPEQPAEKPAA